MLNVQYVTDTNGRPLYVQVPIKEYEKLLADAEELADIAAYKKAKQKPVNPHHLMKHLSKLKPTIANRYRSAP